MEVDEEGVSVEAVSEKKPYRRTANTGRFIVPDTWPKWKKQCGVVYKGRPPCRSWAVVGMPTCKHHGSGGEVNRQRGQLRYLAWVSLGACGLRDMPIELACRTSLGLFAEYIFGDSSNVSTDTQVKAALWLIDMTNKP